jgi:hypothetical protein
MTKTRIDYELPYMGMNKEGLRIGVANAIPSIDVSNIGTHHGNGHPDAISNQHVIGLVFDIDPSNVTQTDVDNVTAEVEALLGTAVYERGWGSHDPDYTDQ